MSTELIDLKKASEFLGVKPSWLRAKVFKKSITFVKLNRLVRFRKTDLEKFVQDNTKVQNQGEL